MDIYEIFSLISVICTVLCVLFVILSVVLFFVFKIPEVIGFLSGSTARKSVELLEKVTTASGPLSRKLGRSGRMERKKAESAKLAANTGAAAGYVPTANSVATNHVPVANQFSEQQANMPDGADATGVLGGQGTTILQENGTTLLSNQQVLSQQAGATSVLSSEAGATALLSEADPLIMTPQMQHELGMGLTTSLEKQDDKVVIGTFQILLDIVHTHSSEVI